jgi:glycosyltransferase involved in cell wall biosynthesis
MRSYRSILFERLSKDLNVDFIFSGCILPFNDVCREVHSELTKTKHLNYKLYPQHNWLPFNGFNFKMFLLPFKYSTIIFSGSLSAPFLILSLYFRLFGMRIIVFDELHNWPNKYKYLNNIVRFLLKFTKAKILCASRYTYEMYFNILKVPKDRLFIAGNPGGNLSRSLNSVPIDKSNNENIDEIKLLYLGRIIPLKCLDIIICAMINLPKKYVLNIYGDGDTEYINFCKQLVIDNNLSKRIIFFESVPHHKVADIMIKSDIFIHIPFSDDSIGADSQTESWGYVINEAISLNKYIISSILCPAAVEAHKLNLPVILLKEKSSIELSRLIINSDFSGFDFCNKEKFLGPTCFINELNHALSI